MISKYLLFPYYLALEIRNRLYDEGKIQSKTFDIPIINVGNVTAGGTGKTPMTEFIIGELCRNYKVAVISRGYKRKGKEFILVNEGDSFKRVGDEPLQIKRKFPNVIVAVDPNRNRAISQLMALPKEAKPEVIVLDDGLQYRRLNARKNIAMVNYNRPIFKDELIPLGRLRDLPEQIRRAQAVVITKAPSYLDEWEREKARVLTRVRHTQKVFFSQLKYNTPKPVFPESGDPRYIYSKEVRLFAGVADDKPLVHYLSAQYDKISHRAYGDHHQYNRLDISHLNNFAKRHPRTFLLTTEKDAQRLLNNKFVSEEVKVRLFYIPIEMEFLTKEENDDFIKFIKEELPVRKEYNGLLF